MLCSLILLPALFDNLRSQMSLPSGTVPESVLWKDWKDFKEWKDCKGGTRELNTPVCKLIPDRLLRRHRVQWISTKVSRQTPAKLLAAFPSGPASEAEVVVLGCDHKGLNIVLQHHGTLAVLALHRYSDKGDTVVSYQDLLLIPLAKNPPLEKSEK